MCLIIDKPANKSVSREILRNAFENNKDGFGLMYAEHGYIKVHKGFNFSDLAMLVESFSDKHLVIHLRTATSGKIDLDNCHPFKLTDDIWFCHNGIISIAELDAEHSDTWHFAEYILGPLLRDKPELFGRSALEDLILSIDKSSKFVLMRSDGQVQIINEKDGKHFEGIWVSNTYSLHPPITASAERIKSNPSDSVSSWETSSWFDDDIAESNPQTRSNSMNEYGYPETFADLLTMEYDELAEFIETNPQETADLIFRFSYEADNEN